MPNNKSFKRDKYGFTRPSVIAQTTGLSHSVYKILCACGFVLRTQEELQLGYHKVCLHFLEKYPKITEDELTEIYKQFIEMKRNIWRKWNKKPTLRHNQLV